jgi:hypothetical protein
MDTESREGFNWEELREYLREGSVDIIIPLIIVMMKVFYIKHRTDPGKHQDLS